MNEYKKGLKINSKRSTPSVRIIEGTNGFYQVGDNKPVEWLGLTIAQQEEVLRIREEQKRRTINLDNRERTRRIKNICYAEQEKHPQILKVEEFVKNRW